MLFQLLKNLFKKAPKQKRKYPPIYRRSAFTPELLFELTASLSDYTRRFELYFFLMFTFGLRVSEARLITSSHLTLLSLGRQISLPILKNASREIFLNKLLEQRNLFWLWGN